MQLNLVQAINQAMYQEMERDKSVMVMGEDVGKDGGVFRVTQGLLEKFGEARVVDTPLAEAGIMGTAIGLAVNGMRPVLEIQFDGFTYITLNQLISHAARMRMRSRGKYTVPLVMRAPWGGGVRALEHHSESMEAIYAHIPGVKTVIPSSPKEAKGLLISAIRDPDPVVFFEPKRLYRAFKEEVPEEPYTIPLGEARILQEGKDITMITWGSLTRTCMEYVQNAKYGIEIIDIRSLSPFDENTVLASVKKTGRAIIVSESPKSGGFAAEISARIAEKALMSLNAPILRVSGYDVPIPLAKLEDYYLPDTARIGKAVEEIMKY
ncbi:alpha-ketoacid dehydrogenase subunit beta [Candidatus Micrarchaeota archaeon]|nr:alpha-ketoacid dehydrogenase subunit beta [Candidatus Micrarchaeota archaeon]